MTVFSILGLIVVLLLISAVVCLVVGRVIKQRDTQISRKDDDEP